MTLIYQWKNAVILLLILLLMPVCAFVFGEASQWDVTQLDAEQWASAYWGNVPHYFSRSLILIFGTAAGCLLLGGGCAWVVAYFDFPLRRFLRWGLAFPLALPAYLIALSYRDFNFTHSLFGAIIVLTLALYPIVYLAAYPVFNRVSMSLFGLAKMSGLSFWGFGTRILWPTVRPVLVLSLGFVMMEALVDLGTVKLLTLQTLSTEILDVATNRNREETLLKLLGLALWFALIIIAFVRWGSQRASDTCCSGFVEAPKVGSIRIVPKKTKALLLTFVLLLPVLVGFVLPIVHFIEWFMQNNVGEFISEWSTPWKTTLALSVFCTCVVAGFVVLFHYFAAHRHRGALVIKQIFDASFVLPSLTLAIICLLHWSAGGGKAFNSSLPFLFTVLLAAFYIVKYAYLASFRLLLSNEYNTGSGRKLLRAMKLPLFVVLRRVHVLALSRIGLVVPLFVALEVSKELSIALMLKPEAFQTISTSIFLDILEGHSELLALPILSYILFCYGLLCLLLFCIFKEGG